MNIEEIIKILKNPLSVTSGEYHDARKEAVEILERIKEEENGSSKRKDAFDN